MSQTFAQLINGKSATVEFSTGSASTPSVAFSSDTNTGIYSPGADQVGISTGGSGRLFITSNGDIGIDKASPEAGSRLHVYQNANARVHVEAGAGYASLKLTGTSSANYIISDDALAFEVNATERLRITSAGLVGVGTSSPGSYYATKFVVDIGASAQDGITIVSGPTANGMLAFADGTTGNQAYRGYINYNHANDYFAINTAAVEAIRIDSSQRVGIGTSSPTHALTVEGGSSDISATFLANSNTTTGLNIRNTGSLATNQSTRIRLVNGPDYFGANSKAYQLINLNTSATDADFRIQYFNGTSFSDSLTIKNGGNVGIGSTAPTNSLEVVGTATSNLFAVKASSSGDCLGVTARSAGNGAIVSALNSAQSDYEPLEINGEVIYFQTRTGAGTVSERARIDSSGRLLVGTSSARANFFNQASTYAPRLQVEGVGSNGETMMSLTSGDTGFPFYLNFARQKSGSIGGNTAVANNDNVGIITFQGSDGSEFVTAAQVFCEIDGTPGANDMPGRLVFSTTADGASSPTERMRISANGFINAANDGGYFSTGYNSHTFTTSQDNWTEVVHNKNATTSYGTLFEFNTDHNNTISLFWRCRGGGNTRADLRANGGLANYQANNVNLSDRNAKKDIAPAAGTWDCIKEWEIVNYRYKDQPDDADLNLGVIAQQVAESCPEVITVFSEAKDAKPAVLDDEGNEVEPAQEAQPEKLGVKEQQMYWMAIKALQEAQVRIEVLEAEVAALKAS